MNMRFCHSKSGGILSSVALVTGVRGAVQATRYFMPITRTIVASAMTVTIVSQMANVSVCRATTKHELRIRLTQAPDGRVHNSTHSFASVVVRQ